MYKNTQNGKKWYLRDAGEQDIGVIDITNDNIEWYLYGNEMFASLRPTDDEKYTLLNESTTTASFSPTKEDPFDDPYKSRYDLRPDTILIHHYDHLGNTRLVYYVKYMGGTNNYNYYARVVLDYYPYAKTLRSWHYGQDTVRYQSTGHERDRETGLDYRWARLYDSDISVFRHPDPMRQDYPSLASYHYTAGNPVYFVDPNGMNLNPYVIFDGQSNTVYLYDDNNTPDDYTDDISLGSYKALNEVTSTSRGKWEDGEYEMLDRNSPHTHGQRMDSRGILLDSDNRAYGSEGIYRAENFEETTTDNERTGMGFHAGRENMEFMDRVTLGCIRTNPDFIDAMDDAIDEYGPWNRSIVTNNRASDISDQINNIDPSRHIEQNAQNSINQVVEDIELNF